MELETRYEDMPDDLVNCETEENNNYHGQIIMTFTYLDHGEL